MTMQERLAPHLTSDVPVWLAVMRAISGTTETPGDADNPKIVGMASVIGATWPDMSEYCELYKSDETAWCGLTAAFCMTVAGIRPPFDLENSLGAQDECFLWALSWEDAPGYVRLYNPVPGAIVVMTRSGGGHVTLFEEYDGDDYRCRGGNQSDAINVQSYSPDDVVALMWPANVPLPPMPRRNLEEGDVGADVAVLQRSLGLPPDGDFGSATEEQVKAFQRACDLSPDGEVGPMTWEEVDALDARMAAGYSGVSDHAAEEVITLAEGSILMDYSWPDRGVAPPGYIPGMALCYALALNWLAEDDAAAEVMAQAAVAGGEDFDALTWYESEIDSELNLDVNKPGVEALRALFALMIGLGMRESSGNYSCGRDQSAGESSQSSDTCEAGLFQMSWNMQSASEQMPVLLEEYWEHPNGFLTQFSEGIMPTASNLETVGSGHGAAYQWLAKFSPAFCVMTAAVGLRTRRQHWGPINRKEVTLSPAAVELLEGVEAIMSNVTPTPPKPRPPDPDAEPAELDIRTKGNLVITVNGEVVFDSQVAEPGVFD